jgi:hypothetical protein
MNCPYCDHPLTHEAALRLLEIEMEVPVLPDAIERRVRTREALRAAERALRVSPIGRGMW